MSDNNSTPAEPTETPEIGLDDFEKDFFGKASETPEVQEDSTPPADEPEDTTEVDGEGGATDDPPANTGEENDDDDDGEGEADPKPQKKSRAQERIEELNAKFREAERRALELEQLLAEKEKSSDPNEPKENEEPKSKSEDEAPHWDDEDENGNKLYPLGQFDPKFNSDLVRFTMQQELKAAEAEKARQAEQVKLTEAEQRLQTEWEEKLTPARERYPDFQEKGQELISRFDNLDQGYAKYLTQTIQSIDNGPDVLYHLASNPDLAQEIVSQGPAMASVALGRLSAQFESKSETPAPKATSAPPPPPRARGSAPPKKRDPLNNLDDFEKDFFR